MKCVYSFLLLITTLNATSIRQKSRSSLPTNPKEIALYVAYQKYFFWLPNTAFVADSNENPNGHILSKIVDEIITSSQNQVNPSPNLTKRLSTYIKNRFRGMITKEVEQEIDAFAQSLALQNNDLAQNHESYYKHLHRKLKQLGFKKIKVFETAIVYWYEGRYLTVLRKHLTTKSDLKMLRRLARKNYSSIHGNIMIDSTHTSNFSLWKVGNNGLKITLSNHISHNHLKQKNSRLMTLKKLLKYTFAPSMTFVTITTPNHAQHRENTNTLPSIASILMDAVRGRPPTLKEQQQITDLNKFKKIDLESFIEDKIVYLNGENKSNPKVGPSIKTFQQQCILKKDKLKPLFKKVTYYQNYIFNQSWHLREILRKENKGGSLTEPEKKDKTNYIGLMRQAYHMYRVESLEHDLYMYVKKRLEQRRLGNLFTERTLKNFAQDFISVDGISFPSYIHMNGLRILLGLKPFKNLNDHINAPLYEVTKGETGLNTIVLNLMDVGEITDKQKKPFKLIHNMIKKNKHADQYNLITTVRENSPDGSNHIYSLKIEKRDLKYFIYYFSADMQIKTNGKLDRLKETIKNSDGRSGITIEERNKHEDRLDYQTSFSNCCGIAVSSAIGFLKSNNPIDPKENMQAKGLRLVLEGLLDTDKPVLKEHITRSRRRFGEFYESVTMDTDYKKTLDVIHQWANNPQNSLLQQISDESMISIAQYKAFFNDSSLLNGDDADSKVLRKLKKFIDHNYPDIEMDESFNFIYIANLLE